MGTYLLITKSALLQLLLPISVSIGVSWILSTIAAYTIIGKRHVGKLIAISSMFSFYGLVLGFMIGASKESISRDAFSAIVTILSGYFGYALSKDLHPRLKAIIPISVTCFLVSLLFSIVYFVKLSKAMAPH